MSVIIQQLDRAEAMLTNALNELLIRQRLAEVGYTEADPQVKLNNPESSDSRLDIEIYSDNTLRFDTLIYK